MVRPEVVEDIGQGGQGTQKTTSCTDRTQRPQYGGVRASESSERELFARNRGWASRVPLYLDRLLLAGWLAGLRSKAGQVCVRVWVILAWMGAPEGGDGVWQLPYEPMCEGQQESPSDQIERGTRVQDSSKTVWAETACALALLCETRTSLVGQAEPYHEENGRETELLSPER